MNEKFLSRWSRRKLDEVEKSAEIPRSAPADASPVEPESMTPEEIAALPTVESINSAGELMVFLRAGIPVALRMAALRKLWLLDPEIRDFVGDARDYAWDWNVPGGVPVSGPLEPSTDVESMVRKIFGEEPDDLATAPDTPARENVIEREMPPRVAERLPQQREEPLSPIAPSEVSASSGEIIPNRHGGALPA